MHNGVDRLGLEDWVGYPGKIQDLTDLAVLYKAADLCSEEENMAPESRPPPLLFEWVPQHG